MDVAGFCSQAHVMVVAGKGGVGKTTVAATLGLVAAQSGLDTMIVALDDSGALPALFGQPSTLGYDDTALATGPALATAAGRLRGRVITSDAALIEYLVDHGLVRVAKRLVRNGALDVIATAIPGIREALVLGKLKQLELARAADLIVVDAPATGHALTFLTSSSGLLDAARGGPLRTQAESVVEMLADPIRCCVVLVTEPEETPVNELIESAYRLEDEVGVKLGPIVVNACYPARPGLDVDPVTASAALGIELSPAVARDLAGAASFSLARRRLEGEQLDRLGAAIALDQLRLPLLFSSELGPSDLAQLAGALRTAIEAL